MENARLNEAKAIAEEEARLEAETQDKARLEAEEKAKLEAEVEAQAKLKAEEKLSLDTEAESQPIVEVSSPIPVSKGYNLDFLDNLDDPNFNPFATKASVVNDGEQLPVSSKPSYNLEVLDDKVEQPDETNAKADEQAQPTSKVESDAEKMAQVQNAFDLRKKLQTYVARKHNDSIGK